LGNTISASVGHLKRECNAVPSTHGEVLTLVAVAMKDISTTQQKLAYNQSLPPIQFQKFSGVPAEFPLFKQRLDGEAKQAVVSLETSKDVLHQALQILEQRYGKGSSHICQR